MGDKKDISQDEAIELCEFMMGCFNHVNNYEITIIATPEFKKDANNIITSTADPALLLSGLVCLVTEMDSQGIKPLNGEITIDKHTLQ